MPRIKRRIACLFLLIAQLVPYTVQQGLGSIQTNVPWRAGHASAFSYPYMIVYSGLDDPSINTSSTQIPGSTGLWIWDSRNGSWYQPSVQVQGGATVLPQNYIKATNLPTSGQIVTFVSNTTTSIIQTLDLNLWSWSFPSTTYQSKLSGYTLTTVNNTLYTYGGLSATTNGYPQINSVQNSISSLDTNSFQPSPGANGLGLADHTTCYLKKCNCLISFGGTLTGNPSDVTNQLYSYNLNAKTWDVQGMPLISNSPIPSARRLHTATCLDDIMVVYGGGILEPQDTNLWLLNATNYPSLFWQQINVDNSSTQGPNLRMGHSAVYDDFNKKIYMYGGWGVSATNDSNTYVLDIVKWSWLKVPTTGYPPNSISSNNNNNPNSTTANTSNQGLATGAIIGIAVGCSIAGIIVICLLFYTYCVKKRRNRQSGKDIAIEEDIEVFPSETTTSTTKTAALKDDTYYNTRRSEIGDSDKVVTGILEEIRDENTVNATYHGSSYPTSPRSSRHSKIFLSNDIVGQVPNEIITQKPNEFSVVLNPPSTTIPSSLIHFNKNIVSIEQPADDSLIVNHHTLDDSLSASNNESIQYIVPDSNNINSIANSTQTWDTTTIKKEKEVNIQHHHPSSLINVAETVTPPITTNNSIQASNIYNTVSPLDALASLAINSDNQLVNALPAKYKIDASKSNITGPSNQILFVIQDHHRKAAIKLFLRREAWERECKTLIKLKSFHIVEILEVLTIQLQNDVKYVTVMERLDDTLTVYKKKNPTTKNNKIVKDILLCLQWCHDNNIAFCDLKPSNIMHLDNQWKLIDFEASRIINEECVSVITPRYCPPEVALATTYGLEGKNGVVANSAIDLWSLGCIVYELETSSPLFPPSIKDETILHFISHPSPDTPLLNNGLRWNQQKELEIPQLNSLISDQNTIQFIKTLLSTNPSHRGTATHLLENPYFN